MERRLAIVLAADAAGYSRLMSLDEGGAYAELTRCRTIIDRTIEQYGGRSFASAGDSVLAEFTSSVNAVQCAIDTQERLEEARFEALSDKPLDFRIGINFGDVIVEDGNLLGDGVNVAARLESIAPEKGVCISGNVMEQVSGKIKAKFGDGGNHKLKNIERPVHVWCWPEARATQLRTKALRASSWRVPAVLGIVAILLASLAFAFFQSPKKTSLVSEKASIAILPFANIGADRNQDYLVDGITSDLITDLSKISGLFVIARNSTFAYKGQSITMETIASELGARFILQGSVRTSTDRLRISAQLINTMTGEEIWADRFDRKMGDVLDLQDEVTREIVSALKVELTSDEEARIKNAKETTSPEAYDFFLRGLEALRQFTPQSTRTARLFFLKALAADPDYARAYAAMAFSYTSNAIFFTEDTDEEDFLQSLNYALRALQLDPTLPQGHFALALTYQRQGQQEKALEAAKDAVRHDPNYSDGYATLSAVLSYMGEGEEAEDKIRLAMSLNPRFPSAYTEVLGRAQFVQRDYENALASFRNCVNLDPFRLTCRVFLAAVYGLRGQKDEAEWEGQEVLTIDPQFNLTNNTIIEQFARQQDRELLVSGLRVAGMSQE